MTRFIVLLLGCLVLASTGIADEGFPRVPPTPPEKAEGTFEVLHGFRMELIAAEPLVVDPVDMAYDEDGRAYVVEMRDYPYPEEKNAEPTEFPGTVRLLEDRDGDGKFDHSTIFADQLAWPTSVICWKGGVFVAAAPDILYLKDTNGDHRADVRRKVFTGFGRYNVQAIMNGLRWGFDNHIYGAAAGNGGNVWHAERSKSNAISLSRCDFRFHPVHEEIERISGGQRYGNTFDDWGNRFVCNIRNPVQHVVLPLDALNNNSSLIVSNAVHDCAESGDQLRVFRISPPEAWRTFRAQRWALEQVAMPRSELIGAGYWTSSSGVTVYRGGAYPPEFRGNVFIGEVAGNLVHRQVLSRDGVTFQSRRGDQNTEFIRSRDNWFRPVNFVNAPDGTLHVLDMYRETIEHPWSIPDDIKAQLDLQSGNDRGRIYRLAPPAFSAPKPPKLSAATTAELVALLESPHGWWRETAQRLLVERQEKSAVEPLRKMLRESDYPQARLHAMYALDGLKALDDDARVFALQDRSSEVIRHALVFAAERAREDQRLSADILAKSCHDDVAVRFEVALLLAELEDKDAVVEGLLNIAMRDADDPWMRIAILTSAPKVADRLAVELARKDDADSLSRGRIELVRQLATTVVYHHNAATNERLLQIIGSRSGGISEEMAAALLSGLGQGHARNQQKLTTVLSRMKPSDAEAIKQFMNSIAGTASDSKQPTSRRLPAFEILTYLDWRNAGPTLLQSLKPTEPSDIQRAALRILGTFSEPDVAVELIDRWAQFTPPLREEVIVALLSRSIWHEPLIAALEEGRIQPAQIPLSHRTRLATIKDTKRAERAKAVFASLRLGPRKEVIDRYESALSLAADTQRGAAIYRRDCANCHRLGKDGHDVGPSLATIQHRSPQEILIHVLDPNREVSPNFLDYSVLLTDGRTLTGIIASETDAGLTLRRAEHQEIMVPRTEIETITTSGRSLMPEGLEQKIAPQEMADLIAYLREPATLPKQQGAQK